MSIGLLLSSGAVAMPSADDVNENDRAMAAMIADAASFLRAGGALSWSDWRYMDVAERSAFVEAGRMVHAERASIAGVASQSMAAAVSVGSVADGGEAAKALAMESALQSVVTASRGNGAPSP